MNPLLILKAVGTYEVALPFIFHGSNRCTLCLSTMGCFPYIFGTPSELSYILCSYIHHNNSNTLTYSVYINISVFHYFVYPYIL